MNWFQDVAFLAGGIYIFSHGLVMIRNKAWTYGGGKFKNISSMYKKTTIRGKRIYLYGSFFILIGLYLILSFTNDILKVISLPH